MISSRGLKKWSKIMSAGRGGLVEVGVGIIWRGRGLREGKGEVRCITSYALLPWSSKQAELTTIVPY